MRPFRGLDNEAYHAWRHGGFASKPRAIRRILESDAPVAGTIRILSRDGGDFGAEDLAAVLVESVDKLTRTARCFLLSAAEDPYGPTAVRITALGLGIPVIVWPQISIELPFDDLGRHVGDGLEGFALARLRTWASIVATDGTAAAADIRLLGLHPGEKPEPGSIDEAVLAHHEHSLVELRDRLASLSPIPAHDHA